ncbi:MAG: transposase family protein [Actinomycetota bacterium]
MISYRATLDVPAATVAQVSRWLAAYRRVHDRRPWQRAATPYVQAVLVLRWFKDATGLPALARDAGIGIATAYRYLHEAIDVIAAQAADLPDVLARGVAEGWEFVCLDGTLIPCVRSATPSRSGQDVWYSGKHHRHGGNSQVLAGPDGYPEWTSEVEPGSTHDLTAARAHALPALYPAAAAGLPTLADKGYTGAGIGIHVPTKGGDKLDVDTRTRNKLINGLRARAESANALLKRSWKALERVTLDPWRIGAITRAALVLLHLQRPVR